MRILFVIIFILSIQMVSGQTISLPDTNLRNKLLKSYPKVMQGDELSLTNAAAHTGLLDLRNSNISNAEGIQYFTKITTLDLSNNLLLTIPSLSATKNLVNFYATNNRLKLLPDMGALNQLQDFQVMNNQLTALPSLPSSLTSLYCTNNKITELPPLTQFPLLQNLVISDNQFKDPIDFSGCINLIQLHIHRIGTDTIIGLDKLKKLTTLYAWGNSIRDLSGLDSITTLSICFVFDNQINKLPYLANKSNLKDLNVANCNLTFEDIIPVLKQGAPAYFEYAPQKPIPFQDLSVRAKNIAAIEYPENKPEGKNIYVLLKDGLLIDSSSSPAYTFNPVNFSDSGYYMIKIYNPAVPDLQLGTNTFHLAVKPCIEFSLPSIEVISKECGKGYTVDFSNARIAGGTLPFTYELNNGTFKEKYNDEVVKNLPAGRYKISIIDSKKCTASDEFFLNQIEKCDPVITPNGDGIADSYFIEKQGKVHIYDMKKSLKVTLQAPVVWDGKDQNGETLDAGYYILTMEGESPVFITIIR